MEELIGMAEVSVVLGSVGVFAAGFLTWLTLWHRRATRALQRVPVGSGRAVRVVRPGVEQRGGTA
jgi:hypothetical protein